MQPPPKLADEHIGINGRLGAAITRRVGTMWAFYLAAVTMASWMVLAGFAWGPLHQIDPYPFAFILFLGNIVQLLLMFVIMVGQQVLGAASDKRAVVTYQDAEAILHECLQMQEHLTRPGRGTGADAPAHGAAGSQDGEVRGIMAQAWLGRAG